MPPDRMHSEDLSDHDSYSTIAFPRALTPYLVAPMSKTFFIQIHSGRALSFLKVNRGMLSVENLISKQWYRSTWTKRPLGLTHILLHQGRLHWHKSQPTCQRSKVHEICSLWTWRCHLAHAPQNDQAVLWTPQLRALYPDRSIIVTDHRNLTTIISCLVGQATVMKAATIVATLTRRQLFTHPSPTLAFLPVLK